MVWHRTSGKPVHDSILTQIYGTIRSQWAKLRSHMRTFSPSMIYAFDARDGARGKRIDIACVTCTQGIMRRNMGAGWQNCKILITYMLITSLHQSKLKWNDMWRYSRMSTISDLGQSARCAQVCLPIACSIMRPAFRWWCYKFHLRKDSDRFHIHKVDQYILWKLLYHQHVCMSWVWNTIFRVWFRSQEYFVVGK